MMSMKNTLTNMMNEGHDDHGHEEHDDHGHHHGEFDIHFWLDPEIEEYYEIASLELSEVDPANQATYQTNASNAVSELDKLINDTRTKINSDAKYIVFHDVSVF